MNKTVFTFSSNFIEQHLSAILSDKEDTLSIANNIIHRWTEPHRCYHNIEHLCYLFQSIGKEYYTDPKSFNKTILNGEHYSTLYIAAMYHDIVYDTHSLTNEEDSIKIMEEDLKNANPDFNIELVRQIIMDTKLSPGDTKSSMASDFFYNIDYGYAFNSELTPEEYERRIRKEYEWVPLEIYKEKRLAFLQGVLTFYPQAQKCIDYIITNY